MYGFYWPSRAWLLAALVPSEDQCSPIQPITASDFHSHDRKNPRGNSPSYPKFLTKFFPWAIRGVTGNRVAGGRDRRPGKKIILYREIRRKSYCTERLGEGEAGSHPLPPQRKARGWEPWQVKRAMETHLLWNWRANFRDIRKGSVQHVDVGRTQFWYPQVTLISAIFEYISLEHQMRVF